MKSGLIDAAEYNNPTADRDFGMQDVSKDYHLASFHQSQEFFEVTFNKKKFDSLPAEHQAILRHASEAESSNFYWHNTSQYAVDLVKLQEESGVRVHRTLIGDEGAAEGMGHRHRPDFGRRPVLRQGCRLAEGLCQGRDELPEPEPA